ncbi:(E E)-alpha-farnesene synthase-like isoform X1 [Prunus yedoensis var. nudiflora]|uniref:(E E)-alpha-farnesene synthase-like isoform X1 n=1 Tax=Prunus yedoensis var. nudiflora TaxID=2094558 RepID=A0A314ZER8_PRUYE|nr:(E E)-alpha-farnesene synthase-like isoform X1 [Prunus yedoensis var. nudiflora]
MDPKTNFQADEHQRRSANYKPNIWKDGFLESLNNKYIGDDYTRQSKNLIEDVKKMFVETEDLIAQLELIDRIGKLGLTNYFEKEIKEALDTIENSNTCVTENLYATALHFKILRQHGYKVSQDVFGGFMDEEGALKESNYWDVKGMLELLEASNLAFEGERILDEAKASATVALRGSNVWNLDNNLARQVVHALELSSHRRVGWFNVKGHIHAYEKDNHANTISLLELAKLNFNMVQAALQKDLREVSMWWNNLGLKEHLKFARDRPVECFMFAVGLNFHPGYTSFRILLSKVINLILIIDDVYDIYGSLEELKIFTNAVDRWDVGLTEQLPECMKICFQVLYNTTCDFAHEIEEESGWNLALPHLSKAAEQERGDAPSAILCYMREMNIS